LPHELNVPTTTAKGRRFGRAVSIPSRKEISGAMGLRSPPGGEFLNERAEPRRWRLAEQIGVDRAQTGDDPRLSQTLDLRQSVSKPSVRHRDELAHAPSLILKVVH
jgi:hypothetical protein